MRSKRRTPKKKPEQTESLMDFWLRNRAAVDEATDRDLARSCESKDGYETREQARAIAAMNGMADALYTYECRYCGSWHLTRRPT